MPGWALLVDPQPAVSEPLWAALRAAHDPASISELHVASRAHPNAIHLRLRRWLAAGFVNEFDGRPKRFAMSNTAQALPKPPVCGEDLCPRVPERTTRDRMWSSMRVLRRFDLPTLMITAEATRRSAEDFINCLLRAGFLNREHRGNSTRGDWSIYVVIRRSGSKTPIVSHGTRDGVRFRQVVDPNDGSTFDISPSRSAGQPAQHCCAQDR
jgi:hypothetical protein